MVWHLRTGFGEEVVISRRRDGGSRPGAVPPPVASLRSVLSGGLLGADRSAREILLQIYRDVSGVDVAAGRERSDLELSRQVLPALERAVRTGQIVVARRARAAFAPPELPPELEPKPDPVPAPEEKAWFSVKVVDEVGDPVGGLDMAYMVAGQRQLVTTDGGGVARLDDVDLGLAIVRVASVPALRQKMAPRWQQPRAPKIPTDGDPVIQELDGSVQELTLKRKTPGLLVITPFFKCHEIPGTHFDFGRSFVRGSGLEPLASIAEGLRGDDGRQAMIFGHTDLSGPADLNKALSERRAKALFALFRHDSAAWEELFSGSADSPQWQEKWGVKETQHMLNALGVTDDDGHPLDEDGVRGEHTKQAVHRFQAGDYPDKPAEQAALPKSDDLGKDGRRELFLAYAKRVTREPVDADRLVKIGDAPFMGCGEFNPLSLAAKDQASRRAVVFVFDPAAAPTALPCKLRNLGPCNANCGPAPTAADPDGKPPYRCKVYKDVASKCPCQGGLDLSHDLVVQIPYKLEEADDLPHSFTLESDDGTITQTQSLSSDCRANDAGTAEIYFTHLPESHAYTLTCKDDERSYTIFEKVPYGKLAELLGGTLGADSVDSIPDDGDDAAPAAVGDDESGGDIADPEAAP